MMYQTMKEKVETALERGYVGNDLVSSQEEAEVFKRWKGLPSHDHPSMIQVFFQMLTKKNVYRYQLLFG